MKRVLLVLIAIFTITFHSCEKVESEEPGNIPGMGDTSGQLEVLEDFVMPEGIHILGEITGNEGVEQGSGSLKSLNASKTDFSCFGSGQQVRLKVTFLNASNCKRTVFLPKGLVWECQLGSAQHGLQVQTVWISLLPNETRTFVIDLYCVNLGLPSPGANDTYKILGVTSSRILWLFLDYIGWKTVNYEMLVGNNSSKAAPVGPSYYEITERFQRIVHNLTYRGIELSDEDVKFIESIPELPVDKRPVLDENSQYPEYFEEFTISKK